MPVMTTWLFDRQIDIELNQYGDVMGYTDTRTGEELKFDDTLLMRKGYFSHEIADFMDQWNEELEEHINARGRDRLGDD